MNPTKFILPVVLFILVIASGFWVAKSGKPYNTGIFAVHKLIALACVILTVIAIINLLKISPTQTLTTLLLVIAGLSAIVLFASGGLMSALKTPGSIWLLIHRIAPFLLVGSATTAIMLLLKK